MTLEEPHLNAIGVKIQTLLFPVFIGIIQKPHCLSITKICINYIRNKYMYVNIAKIAKNTKITKISFSLKFDISHQMTRDD